MCHSKQPHNSNRPIDLFITCQKPFEFSRHRPSVWLSAIDELGDGLTSALPATSVVFTLTAIARSLLSYGAAFADRALPVLSALEYTAEHRVASDELLAEARVLRFRAQVAASDFAGECVGRRVGCVW